MRRALKAKLEYAKFLQQTLGKRARAKQQLKQKFNNGDMTAQLVWRYRYR